MKTRRIGTIRCSVGEGPVWDVLDQALYFVDVTAQLLWRYEPQGGNFTKWKMPSMIGSLALREEGGAIVALQDGFHRFDFAEFQAEGVLPEMQRSLQIIDDDGDMIDFDVHGVLSGVQTVHYSGRGL